MNGIINSELDPLELCESHQGDDYHETYVVEKLLKALGEQDYLIALIQKSVYDGCKYSATDPRFGDITPNQYVSGMKVVLDRLEKDLWQALDFAQAELKNRFEPVKAHLGSR